MVKWQVALAVEQEIAVLLVRRALYGMELVAYLELVLKPVLRAPDVGPL